jgi:hypothetical protein
MDQVKPARAGNVVVPIRCDYDGVFRANWNGNEYSADTRQQLADRLADAARQKRIRVEIPFMIIEGDQIKPGVATGIHASNGQILARVDGKPSQFRWYNVTALGVLTEHDIELGERLLEARTKAYSDLKAFIDETAIPLEQMVRDAVAQAAAPAPEEET